MSSKSLSTRLSGDLKNRFATYLEESDHDTPSEASRSLIDDGLRQHGYHPAESEPPSKLRRFNRHLAHGFAISGLILFGMSAYGNSGVQTFTAAVFAVAFALYLADRAAGRYIDRLQEVTGLAE